MKEDHNSIKFNSTWFQSKLNSRWIQVIRATRVSLRTNFVVSRTRTRDQIDLVDHEMRRQLISLRYAMTLLAAGPD